jgi:hypothetical protein
MRILTLSILILACCLLRSHATDSTCPSEDELIALAYLREHTSQKVPFRIHGWRWHTMSVLRELNILYKAWTLGSTEYEGIVAAVHHTIGFNLKGLHRVETTLFFPFLSSKFDTISDSVVRKAFQQILFSVEQNQQSLLQHGKQLVS